MHTSQQLTIYNSSAFQAAFNIHTQAAVLEFSAIAQASDSTYS
jgi:hypothetical protein